MSVTDLLSAVRSVSRAVPTRPTVPVAGTVRLVATRGGDLEVWGTDLDVTVTARVPGRVARGGEVLVPPRPVADWLAAATRDRSVTLSVDGDHLVLTTATGDDDRISGEVRFRTVNDTWVAPPGDPEDTIGLDPGLLVAVSRALDPCPSNPRWVFPSRDGDRAAWWAVDAGTAWLVWVSVPFPPLEVDGALPADPVHWAARAGTDRIEVGPAGGWVRLAGPTGAVTVRPVRTRPPDIGPLLERAFNQPSWELDHRPVAGALARLGALRPVTVDIEISGDRMVLSAVSEDYGDAHEAVPVTAGRDTPGQGAVTGAFAPGVLTPALGALPEDTPVRWYWQGGTAPAGVEAELGEVRYRLVVMPVQRFTGSRAG